MSGQREADGENFAGSTPLERVSERPIAPQDDSVAARTLVVAALARLSAESVKRIESTAPGSMRLERLRFEIGRVVQALDATLSAGLAAILCNSDVRRLEGSWRGLQYLCSFPPEESGSQRKIELLDLTWQELADDLDQPADLEASRLFALLYDERLDMPNGEPIGLLLVDFEFGSGCRRNCHLQDVEALRALSIIAERAFCPVVANASPGLLLCDNWADLAPGTVGGVIEDRRLIRYRSLREALSSRFLVLALPRILARSEWTGERVRHLEFRFDERAAEGVEARMRSRPVASDGEGDRRDLHEGSEREFGPLWCGAAFGVAAAAIQCFDRTGWFADLRGADVSDGRFEHAGGMIPAPDTAMFAPALATVREKLPGDLRYFDEGCAPSVECVLEESVEHDLQAVGLLPVSRCRFTRSLAVYGVRSVHRPADNLHAESRDNARMAALVPHTLCACRIAHYVRQMIRDKIGSWTGPDKIQESLNSWLVGLCDPSDDISDLRRLGQMPLRDQKVDVRICGPGVYECVIGIEPRIQFEVIRGRVELPPVRFAAS